eukprot:2746448-Prymnesium_polylepis.1
MAMVSTAPISKRRLALAGQANRSGVSPQTTFSHAVLTSLSGIFDAVTAGDIWFDYAMLTIAIGLVLVLQ